MIKIYQTHLLVFIFTLASQILLFGEMVLFGRAFCFIYLLFPLLIPFRIGTISLLFIGLITGIILDMFYDSFGLNASALVLMCFLRPIWINLLTTRGYTMQVGVPSIPNHGFVWFSTYALPLIFIYIAALFYAEMGGFQYFFYTFSKVVFSTIYTYFMIVVVQFLFFKPEARSGTLW